jgi:uncharacterized protein YjbI with pentapeptide repeats
VTEQPHLPEHLPLLAPDIAPRRISTRTAVESLEKRAIKRNSRADLRGCRLEGVALGAREGQGTQVWQRLVFGISKEEPGARAGGTVFQRAKDYELVPSLRCLFSGTSHDTGAAMLDRAVFRKMVLRDCEFVRVALERVDFTECVFERCDFRFATFHGVGLGYAKFINCDLFGAMFESGTVATGLKFELSTLPELSAGITGLGWHGFSHRAIAGEAAEDYEELLKRTEHDRTDESETIASAVDNRLQTVADSYRTLAGYWAIQGRFSDANKAYAKCRRWERKSAGPVFFISRRVRKEGSFKESRDDIRATETSKPSQAPKKRLDFQWFTARQLRPLRWAGLWVADLVSGFGQSLVKVLLAIVAVTVLPGFLYSISHSVKGAHDIWDSLTFSVFRLTAYTSESLKPATRIVELGGVLQSAAVIALVGLLGYVLGNYLRQS